MRYTISFVMATLACPALADVPTVVTDIAPVQSLVAQVMGDLGTPILLLDKGADAHDFALKPSQLAAVARADVLFWVGPGLTPWLERAMAGAGVTDKAVGLLDAPTTHRMTFAEEGANGGDLAGKLADHGPVDPHAWLDPNNAKAWLDLIAADLAAADPEHAAIYAANAAAAKAGIDNLAKEVGEVMAPVKTRPVVLFHDAYAYFAASFGLTVAGTISESDAAMPGAARIAEVQGLLAEAKAVCIFPEANHDPKYIATVTEGTEAKIGGALDPEGSQLAPGPGLYGELVRGLANTLAACLSR